MTLAELNHLSQNDFIKTLGAIYEHSPWVAEAAYIQKPFESLEYLHSVMSLVVAKASQEMQLDLICAHPDLAGKAALAGDLTEHSKHEQAGAGLNSLSQEEYQRFHDLNNRYKAKFSFPFILAVKGHTKHSILASFEERLPNDLATEKARALQEINKIAYFRLQALLQESGSK
jgi:2-oxo-4-hydroxy-4-carboxy-5-ureidoimidazoline decarboxylase